jgi:hypothetical protein
MRLAILLLGTSMLAACGGGGTGPVATAGTTPVTAPPVDIKAHTFVAPTKTQVYKANGASQTLEHTVDTEEVTGANGVTTYSTSGQYKQLYQGNATTVRASNLSITYTPRDAIFDISLNDVKAGLSFTTRYQDPIHRTDFGGVREPQESTPNLTLPGLLYLEAATLGSDTSFFGLEPGTLRLIVPDDKTGARYSRDTFFYQKPGTTTKYVTFAGFLRNQLTANVRRVEAAAATPTTPAINASTKTDYTFKLARGAFVFGDSTLNSNVQKTGTGTFTGSMLATSVLNDVSDTDFIDSTYFQWIEGISKTNVNFGDNTFSLVLNGDVLAPQLDGVTDPVFSVKGGAKFNAEGSGRIDLVAAGGFVGQFQRAWFVNPDSSRLDVAVEGSSIDGGFYGPAAEEVGGSFRIVGGNPDERVDILGVFTGKK